MEKLHNYNNIYFTSESVSEGHPDKLCDQISDLVLDECLKQDKNSRVACEVFITNNNVFIGGEITSKAVIDYKKIVSDLLKNVGYNNNEWGIDYNNFNLHLHINKQSHDIAMGVNNEGAGDQGIMFGYACNETENKMPLAISMAHDLVRLATKKRKTGEFKYARPDMKSQVTVEILPTGEQKLDTILMSIQHEENYDEKAFKLYIYENIMKKIAVEYDMNTDFKFLINPTGRFVTGGPKSDAGLTGRKIIVDTYGGYARHGGGAFSGKDGTKVDRSASYMARYIAKNIVGADIADKCEIQLAYAIGVKQPVSVNVNTFNTIKDSRFNDLLLTKMIYETFDLSPFGIIDQLSLRYPNFFKTSKYGHFGRSEGHFSWEEINKTSEIKKFLENNC
ncbi:methionine adenosyltransferase [Spiroplasma endosymbiont of Anurida maritima]|uniref:methionine adenosyltransferase n=1 Tax=Spiroplasma endosymbiont of Anurida maritima TaxID=2967972 RepID=UPI0036D3F27A